MGFGGASAPSPLATTACTTALGATAAGGAAIMTG